MALEDEIFKQYIIDKDKLIAYGFREKDSILYYEKVFSGGDFKAVITFDKNIKGKIFDLSLNEEYINFRIENSSGFGAKIRQKYINLLNDIKDKCSYKQPYQFKQAQNINEYIIKKYQDMPEFLWKNFPGYAIYRKKTNSKWYAFIGNVPLNKTDKNSKSKETVEILNVKINKEKIEALLNKKGIYEAYHMNKQNWVSIILDETIEDSEIQKLVDESYKIA